MSRAAIGILSLGDMGGGIAKLLTANGYRVLTVGKGRRYTSRPNWAFFQKLSANQLDSQATLQRAIDAGAEILATDGDLVMQSDYILSIVPPRDALATAKRVAQACSDPIVVLSRKHASKEAMYFLDLNAISPKLARQIATLFPGPTSSDTNSQVPVAFVDGGIIGAPPSYSTTTTTWNTPSIPTSSAHTSLPFQNPHLASTLNITHISNEIGPASTLKLTFASLTKGLTALSILATSTAKNAGVYDHLISHLEQRAPGHAKSVKGMGGMPPKAYRWVEEMRGIGSAMDTEGNWAFGPGFDIEEEFDPDNGLGSRVYGAFADLYGFIADETILGEEKVGLRNRGKDAEDVAGVVAETLEERREDGLYVVREV